MSTRACGYSALSICKDDPYGSKGNIYDRPNSSRAPPISPSNTKTTPITNPNIDSKSNSSSTPAPAPSLDTPKPTSSSNSSSPTSSINNSLSPASPPSNIIFSLRNNSSSANPPGEINYKPPVSSSSRSVLVAITTTTILVGGVILIAMAILAFKYTQKRRQKRNGKTAPHDSGKSGEYSKFNSGSIEKFLEEFSQAKPMRFTPQHLQTFTDGYKEKLGSGGFGEVFKGKFPNGIPVAVKVLREIAVVNEQFLAEVGTIGRTYHINLVRLYGFCFDDKVKALVYEYMEKGSLQTCLDDKHSIPGWEKLYQIAIGTAKGIRYLHEECEKVIIHYDIKPGNVLLDNNLSPKVADFGMAELWDRESTVFTISQGRGTPGFIAPELSPNTVTHKSDVYSFGMFLFQIVGSKMKKLDDCNQGNSASWVREKAGKGEFESILSSCGIQEKERMKVERMCKVALVCAQIQHKARPSMSNVLRMLEGEQEIGVPVVH